MTDSGQDLYLEMQTKTAMLDKALHQFGNRGRAKSQAECNYRMALSEKMLTERANGTPVTILSDICRGDPKIAKLRMERDIAEVVYKSAQEAINCYKIQIRILADQIDREYRG